MSCLASSLAKSTKIPGQRCRAAFSPQTGALSRNMQFNYIRSSRVLGAIVCFKPEPDGTHPGAQRNERRLDLHPLVLNCSFLSSSHEKLSIRLGVTDGRDSPWSHPLPHPRNPVEVLQYPTLLSKFYFKNQSMAPLRTHGPIRFTKSLIE